MQLLLWLDSPILERQVLLQLLQTKWEPTCFRTICFPLQSVATIINSLNLGKGRNKDKCMFLLYIHANSLSNLKKSKKGSDGSGGIGAGAAVDFSIKELYAIQEIQSQENLFKLIIGWALYSQTCFSDHLSTKTTCLQQSHFMFTFKIVSHWNMY